MLKGSSSLLPVITGFGVMLLLLVAVTAISVTHISQISGELTAIVSERNQKSAFVARLQGLNLARYQSLRLASLMDDAFERDDELMRFSSLALDFIHLRERFQALPLDQDEIEQWHALRAEIRAAEAIAEVIVDLLQRNALHVARARLDDELSHAQERVASGWTRLLALQTDKNQAALSDAYAASTSARSLAILLSAIACLVGILVAVFVVRLSRRQEKALFEEKEHAQVTLHAIGDAVLRVDRALGVVYLNPVAEHLLGGDGRALVGQPLDHVLRLHCRGADTDLIEELRLALVAGRHHALPACAMLRAREGIEYEVEGQCSPVRTHDGESAGGVLVLRDVSEAREMQRKLHWQANHDSLTRLLNRHAFEERVSRALTGQRRGEFPMTLMFIDLDRFKQVNDGAGHAAGDELLRQVGSLMQRQLRETDIVARMGGDEFAILLPSCPDDMAEKIAKAIRDSVAAHRFEWAGSEHGIGASIGVVHIPPTWNTFEACLAAADAACYQAKQAGRNDIYVHQP